MEFNELLRGRRYEAAKPVYGPYEHQEYPKGLHHPEQGFRTAATPEQAEAMLANGWYESPADFPQAADENSAPAVQGEASVGRTDLLNEMAKLEADKGDLQAQLDAANAKQSELQAALDAAKTENEHHLGAIADLKKQLKATPKAK